MNKKTCLSIICAFAINATATDIGTISVESSTINVNDSKATEVSTVNYIDSKQIQEIGPRQINEVLQTIPGVTADVRPNEVVEIHMRGVNQQEYMGEDSGVAIIVDGVPVYAKSGKFRINMSDIKSIKVIKGSASYLYGNTATGGAVIITTSRPRGDKNQILLGVEYGSFGYQDYNLDVLYGTENFAINLNADDRSTDGYWKDSSFKSRSFGGKATYYIDNTSDITVGIDKTTKFEEKDKSSVTGVTATKYDPQGIYNSSAFQNDNDVELDKYFLKYNKEFANNSNLLVNVYDYVDNYDYISSPQSLDINGNPMPEAYSKHSLQHKKQKGFKLEYNQEFNELAYMLGYEYGDREYLSSSETLIDYTDTKGKQYYNGETSNSEDNQKLHAFYGELKYAITSKLTTTFNMRHDIQKDEYNTLLYDFDGTTWQNVETIFDRTFHENAYRLGATYNLSEQNTLFTNISTGYRTPSVDKIQANIENGSSLDIKKQTSITYEIGNRGKISDLDYEVTIFQIDTKDIIGREFGTYSEGDVTNVGDARNRGVELSLKSNPEKMLSFNLAYTYLKSEYTKHNPFHSVNYHTPTLTYNIVGNELPRVPNHKIDIYTTYKATKNLKFISEIYAQSSYYADEINRFKMPGYAYVNLQSRYTLKYGEHNFEFFAKVNNIFDKQYYRTVYDSSDKNKDGIRDQEDLTITVDPGRVYYAGLKYKF